MHCHWSSTQGTKRTIWCRALQHLFPILWAIIHMKHNFNKIFFTHWIHVIGKGKGSKKSSKNSGLTKPNQIWRSLNNRLNRLWFTIGKGRPAVVFAPFGRGLRVIGGWRETYFWDVCSTVLWGWKLGLDGLETVWGVWNQARSFGFSILIILLFWKISIRRLVPELVLNRTKKHLMMGGVGRGSGGPFSYCKSEPTEKV